MRSSISWIDRAGLADTLARMASRERRLPSPVAPAPPPEPAVAPLDEDGEETVVELVAEPASPRLLTPFSPPSGALRTRLEAFVGWLLEHSGCGVAFIVDKDGLPLVEREADADLLAIAASVMQLIETINGRLLFPLGQTVTLELEHDQLMLTAVETPIGKYIVGQVGTQSMDRDLRLAMAEGLRRTFRPSVESQHAVAPQER
jgi:predicted regulator of Ras-like GTPase activity (Roadblock/LC7/MglB family)